MSEMASSSASAESVQMEVFCSSGIGVCVRCGGCGIEFFWPPAPNEPVASRKTDPSLKFCPGCGKQVSEVVDVIELASSKGWIDRHLS